MKEQSSYHLDMEGMAVHLTVDCDSLDSKLLACSYNTAGNLSALREESAIVYERRESLYTGWQ